MAIKEGEHEHSLIQHSLFTLITIVLLSLLSNLLVSILHDLLFPLAHLPMRIALWIVERKE
jgi:hypothetical protein